MSDAEKNGGPRSPRNPETRSVVRAVRNSVSKDAPASSRLHEKRRLLANFCQLLGGVASGGDVQSPSPALAAGKSDPLIAALSPRIQQTLLRLLAGDSEKQIAAHLGVSKHTIHGYVKTLHRHFQVRSRGELLAKFVDGAYRAGSRT